MLVDYHLHTKLCNHASGEMEQFVRSAIDRGIEGYVIVEFTVTKTGAVKDPVVVEYHPSTIFNKAALAAALKFKYKPRIVNGEPIEVRGVLNKINFELED